MPGTITVSDTVEYISIANTLITTSSYVIGYVTDACDVSYPMGITSTTLSAGAVKFAINLNQCDNTDSYTVVYSVFNP